MGGGGHVTPSKLKLIKYVATEENDDILEELDLWNLVKAIVYVDMVPRRIDLV
jgi:thioredoxin-related protein